MCTKPHKFFKIIHMFNSLSYNRVPYKEHGHRLLEIAERAMIVILFVVAFQTQVPAHPFLVVRVREAAAVLGDLLEVVAVKGEVMMQAMTAPEVTRAALVAWRAIVVWSALAVWRAVAEVWKAAAAWRAVAALTTVVMLRAVVVWILRSTRR
jgi:hypothetical protein